MYVNTLISLQENIPTYGVEGKTVTGHVTISTPGIIRCYVQNLKRTNNRTFELYVLSSAQNMGVKIGELGADKETKWRVDEHNVMGASISLKDIDGVAIIVKENDLRGVDAILIGFKNERFTMLPILESIVKRDKTAEERVQMQSKLEEKVPVKKETNIQESRPHKTEVKKESASIKENVKENHSKESISEEDEVVKGVLGKVIGKQILEGKTPGNDVLEYPSPEDPDVKATQENSKKALKQSELVIISEEQEGPGPEIIPKVQQEPGPEIIPKVQQEPGPVIIPKVEQEPGPVIIPKVEQEPGPVIIPKVEQEPGPVIIPKVEQEPGPVIIPKVEQEPGPVIIPKVEQEPGPVIIPKVEQEPGPVIIPKVEQEPEPVIIPKVEQEPGPVIIPKVEQEPGPEIIPKVEQEPGPVIIPKVEQEPGPVIIPKVEQEPGPVIIPKVEQEPGPVIIPKVEQEPGPVIIPQDQPQGKPCHRDDRKDSLAEKEANRKAYINQIAEKIKKVEKEEDAKREAYVNQIASRINEVEKEEKVWRFEVKQNIEEKGVNVPPEETPEEIDYLAEIEKKLQEIQSRLKNVRSAEEDQEENEEEREQLEPLEEEKETPILEQADHKKEDQLKEDENLLNQKEILRTESAIGDILKKVQSLKKYGSQIEKEEKISIEEQPETEAIEAAEAIEDNKVLKDAQQKEEKGRNVQGKADRIDASKGMLEKIYEKGENVEDFIQEEEDTEWVKIPYGEFLKIPTLTYEWCTQPFITFAFYKYNEILLGHNGEGEYYLGIPDVYHPDRKAILSDPIPVERFLCRRNVQPAIGEYGYWIIPLKNKE